MQQDKIVEISNIPYKTYDQAIWRFIEETRPKRLHRKLRLKDGKWLAFDVAFVEYYSIEDAGSCFKFNGAKFDGRSLNVNWTSSTVLDSSTIRTYNNHPPSLSSSFNRRPSPDYSLGTATSRDEKFPRRRSREKSRDRDRERSYEKDRDRDRRNRDRKRPRRSSKERSSSRDKRRHTSRSPPSVVDSSKASSSQALSEISPSPLTIAVVEPMVEKDKKERRESIENSANIQPNAKVEMKPTLVPETPEKEPKSAVVDNGKASTMTCVFMSGLGPNVNVADILNFFKSFNPVPAGVRLNLEPRGTAYVEFDSPAGCEQAFRCKNRHYIGVQVGNSYYML
uniref:RRM domain-containing protein n=1 Tax=Romanomermis culicivorax TaxID=13658 RepID=A0A915ITH3_ROMCU